MKTRTYIGCIGLALLMLQPGFAMPVEDAIKARIMDYYQLDPISYEIEILTNSLNEGEVIPEALTIRPMSQKEPLGLLSIKAVLSEAGGKIKQAQIQIRIRRYAKALVATGHIRQNDILDSSAYELKRVETTTLQENALTNGNVFIGMRSKRNLNRGQILTAEAFETIPTAKTGDAVTIVFENAGFSVSTEGKLLQSGLKGDLVKVRNTSSGKIVIAKIVDSHSVVVTP
ncbi:MAG: flagellar basal body P-ring formation chaperone FlgA [candidate division Zixibacteria bacterium]|nr:flagellar basal body P-ring formation chaperone FlgA [candidate division Zixibacteria bacterium]